jgi:1,4-alpha-glucan branching enzyme
MKTEAALARCMFAPEDLHYFNEGRHFRLYEKLGAHIVDGGVHFAVWAPNAEKVSVIGDFNGWDKNANPLRPVSGSGIWAGIAPRAKKGHIYKYSIVSRHGGFEADKADPMAICGEAPPRTGSVVWDREYKWGDGAWMRRRAGQDFDRPISIYELHPGSWRRRQEEGNRPLSYRELAHELVAYLKETAFTHVELMPVMEHPFGGSWGYQVTGYFAPTCRFGSPQDFMYLIDTLHQAGIGVILDWVPSHFPDDPHGLGFFDGTHLYDHADPRQGYHPDWDSRIFNYGRAEVKSFLISSAMCWLDKFHADGLRVDAVASMLYLDYSRGEGEWIPNRHGGRENLEAVDFLQEMNVAIHGAFPGALVIAEESTSWPMVSRPVYSGGLGFDAKWDMGWMHDTIGYFQKDPLYRAHHQDQLTFRSLYAFHENFILSLSHDEVVHGKGSMIGKMPGDDWQKFANLRCLYAYMYALPGKRLMFMGNEFAQRAEWDHDGCLGWELLRLAPHAGMLRLVGDLNRLYRREPALGIDFDPAGFEWLDASDAANSVLSFVRRDHEGNNILCIFNFTPTVRENYRIGVPFPGTWREIFNSDARIYGGGDVGGGGRISTEPASMHGRPQLLTLTLPPLGGVFLKWMP